MLTKSLYFHSIEILLHVPPEDVHRFVTSWEGMQVSSTAVSEFFFLHFHFGRFIFDCCC